MIQTFLFAIPMAFLWMIFGRQITPQGFLVGYIFGLAIILLIRNRSAYTYQRDTAKVKAQERRFSPNRVLLIPLQLFWLGAYMVQLAYNILLGGIDVAVRVLKPGIIDPTHPDNNGAIDPEIIAINTQDETHDPLVTGLSAHSITITPGELVVDFDITDGQEHIMLVHVLDQKQSNLTALQTEQANRLRSIKRILGRD